MAAVRDNESSVLFSLLVSRCEFPHQILRSTIYATSRGARASWISRSSLVSHFCYSGELAGRGEGKDDQSAFTVGERVRSVRDDYFEDRAVVAWMAISRHWNHS